MVAASSTVSPTPARISSTASTATIARVWSGRRRYQPFAIMSSYSSFSTALRWAANVFFSEDSRTDGPAAKSAVRSVFS